MITVVSSSSRSDSTLQPCKALLLFIHHDPLLL